MGNQGSQERRAIHDGIQARAHAARNRADQALDRWRWWQATIPAGLAAILIQRGPVPKTVDAWVSHLDKLSLILCALGAVAGANLARKIVDIDRSASHVDAAKAKAIRNSSSAGIHEDATVKTKVEQLEKVKRSATHQGVLYLLSTWPAVFAQVVVYLSL